MTHFKRPLCLLLALLLSLALCASLLSCGEGTSTDDPKEPEQEQKDPTDDPKDDPKDPADVQTEGKIVIADASGVKLTLVRGTDLQNDGSVDCELLLRSFIESVGKKIKTDLISGVTVRRDSQSAVEDKSILFCVTKNYADAIAMQQETPLTGYSVAVKNGSLIVAAHGNAFAKEALDHVLKALVVIDGKVCLDETYTDYYDAMPTHNFPEFVTAGRLEGVYDCYDTTFEYSYAGATEKEVTDYYAALEKNGYVLYAQNQIGTSTFRTYTSKEATAYVGWHPARKQAKIILAPSHDYIPPVTPEATVSVGITPYLVQLGRKGTEQSAPGMGYVMQLSDGRYILMDGGPMNADDLQALYNYLVANKPAKHAKPVIAAWFFSHLHGDHTGLALTFLSNYRTQIELEMIAFNFPNFSTLEVKNETASNSTAISLLKNARAVNPDVTFWKFHAGQKLTIADAEIEILFTHEELYPLETPWGNHTSSAWTVTVGGVKTTFLGDCEISLCQFMDDCYGDAMKTDILQVAHHGFNGASPDLYKDHCLPEVSLFACDTDRFLNDERCIGTQKGFEFNAWVRANSDCYCAGYTTKITFTGSGQYSITSER